jgi:hypothetical protein
MKLQRFQHSTKPWAVTREQKTAEFKCGWVYINGLNQEQKDPK